MKRRYHDDDDDLLQDRASAHLPRVHDGTGEQRPRDASTGISRH